MATKITDPLTAIEVEMVAGLDVSFRPKALLSRQRVLTAGVPFTFISGRRSRGEQERAGSANPLAAPVGKSKHEIGFAYDFTGPRNQTEWMIAGRAIVDVGLESGVFYKNDPEGRERGHVEEPGTRADLFAYVGMSVLAVAALLGIALHYTSDK